MYTFNLYCFGHDMSKNKKLNNELWSFDVYFNVKIDDIKWEIDFPYHGGKVRGDCYSCVFGTIITDDDNNPDFISTVRHSLESYYIDTYNKFLSHVFDGLESDYDSLPEGDDEKELFGKLIEDLREFTSKNEPGFYSVEVSS